MKVCQKVFGRTADGKFSFMESSKTDFFLKKSVFDDSSEFYFSLLDEKSLGNILKIVSKANG